MARIPGFRLKMTAAILISVTLTAAIMYIVDVNAQINKRFVDPVTIKYGTSSIMTTTSKIIYIVRTKERLTAVTSTSTETMTKRFLPTIFVVTPTYSRPVQMPELTNMCNLLSHVQNVLWIVVEDSVKKTETVTAFLARCKVPSVHLNVKSRKQPERTIAQRNLAINWIRQEVNRTRAQGVLYFADDDNTYDPQVFEEMRYTKKISVWPVGLAANVAVETAIVENGTVVDWLTGFHSRDFAVDMAGFAINVKLLEGCPECAFCYAMGWGYMETQFIEQFDIPLKELEPKADNCTKVLVWHTQRVKPDLKEAKPGKERNYTIPKFNV